MAETLQGKIALVTGASLGIGEATALRLAAAGATVLAVARGEQGLAAVVERIRAAGGQAFALAADLVDAEQVQALVGRVRAEHGRIDILVNCAGLKILAPIERAEREDWKRMLEINLLAVMDLTQSVLPLMKEQGGGHVVNISSLAGRAVMPGGSVYSVSKFGVIAFSEALRKEACKDRIRVSVIEPGGPIAKAGAPRPQSGPFAGVEPILPEDIAEAIHYAVSQPARVNVNEILVTPTEYVR